MDRLLARHVAFSLRRPWVVVFVALAAFLLAAPAAVRLYTDLRTDLRELLPKGAPAATALDSLEKRVGSFDHLSIVVDTVDLKAGERFVDALEARLRQKLIPGMAREIRARLDEDRAFFEAHGALYADRADLEDLDRGIESEIERAKIKAAGLDLGLDDEAERKKADAPDPRIERVVKKLEARVAEGDHFLDGYLAGDGGRTLVLLVFPPDGSASLDKSLALYDAVDAEVKALDPKTFHPSMRVGYDGEVREVIEAQEHLLRDLEVSSLLVLVLVAVVIVAYNRSLRAVPILAIPVLVGSALTFAAGRLVIGYLNPNTAFLGSIIAGNGINAGIILLARYLEERRGGRGVNEALPVAAQATWRATLVASGAATASYACLGVTGFRGFNQFAFIGGLGMVLVWMTTYGLMPAIVVLFERRRSLVSAKSTSSSGLVAGPLGALLGRRAVIVSTAALALTTAAGILVVRFARDPMEYDFTHLASRSGAVDGAAYWGKRLDAVMQSYVTPTVVLTESAEKAAAVRRALVAEKAAEGATSPIAEVTTLADLLPENQEAKLAVLRRMRERLTDRVVRALPEERRALVTRLKERTELRAIGIDDLPSHARRLFREKDGQVGRIVLVYPTLGATAVQGKKQIGFARDVRATAAKADPKAEVAGAVVLTADIVGAITKDGALATLLSFSAVALLTFLVMGKARHALWVVGSLAAGTLWMGGAMALSGVKLNFVNFAVLPITFGIGVDYAVNLYERYRELGPGSASIAVASSGGAVALCSLTTVLGYGALLIADNGAIFSFGLTAVLGEITCLAAALVGMPALLAWRDKRRAGSPEAAEATSG